VTYDQWDVVVVPFPFTDRPVQRRRPALVVSQPGPLSTVIGHSVLAMITSAGHRRWPLDVPICDLTAAALPAPSVVRMRLFTLDERLIERRAGALAGEDVTVVAAALSRVFEVIALTNDADGDLVEQKLSAGSISYLLKDSRPEALAQAIRDARRGRGTIDSSAMRSVMTRQQDELGKNLTLREREVLALLAAGMGNKEIAEQLTLSVGTVRLHVSSILAKLEAPNRTSAAIKALKHGLA
jgi:mRNA interferase MazF